MLGRLVSVLLYPECECDVDMGNGTPAKCGWGGPCVPAGHMFPPETFRPECKLVPAGTQILSRTRSQRGGKYSQTEHNIP